MKGGGEEESGSILNYKNPAITATAVHAHHAGCSQTLSPHSPASPSPSGVHQGSPGPNNSRWRPNKTCVPLAPPDSHRLPTWLKT